MKEFKVGLAVLVAALMAMGIAGQAQAFHSGGVAECEGCHSMHNSFDGVPNVTNRSFAQGTGGYLLKANDASGSCLNCHGKGTTLSSYHISTEAISDHNDTMPAQMTPGGDFSWLKKTMDVVIRGTTAIDGNLGERHGHNVVAEDFGYSADGTLTIAPGGSYDATKLGCQSCHDPHGRTRRFADGHYATTGLPIFNSGSYNNSKDPTANVSAVGAYRILGGMGYAPKSYPGVPFANEVPSAVVASSYNRSELTSQTGIAYGAGMSEWCANCHSGMHSTEAYVSGAVGLRHPAGNAAKLTTEIAANYNAYVTSGVMTNINDAYAFSTLTPFEIGSNDFTFLKTKAVTSNARNNQVMPAASTANNVQCLSCHRAHASGFESSLRFFYLNEFMTIADASNNAIYDPSTTENKVNYGYSAAMQQRAYYDRSAAAFGPYARNQCNKCHAKD